MRFYARDELDDLLDEADQDPDGARRWLEDERQRLSGEYAEARAARAAGEPGEVELFMAEMCGADPADPELGDKFEAWHAAEVERHRPKRARS